MSGGKEWRDDNMAMEGNFYREVLLQYWEWSLIFIYKFGIWDMSKIIMAHVIVVSSYGSLSEGWRTIQSMNLSLWV